MRLCKAIQVTNAGHSGYICVSLWDKPRIMLPCVSVVHPVCDFGNQRFDFFWSLETACGNI